jgi:hypothetical protein
LSSPTPFVIYFTKLRTALKISLTNLRICGPRTEERKERRTGTVVSLSLTLPHKSGLFAVGSNTPPLAAVRVCNDYKNMVVDPTDDKFPCRTNL